MRHKVIMNMSCLNRWLRHQVDVGTTQIYRAVVVVVGGGGDGVVVVVVVVIVQQDIWVHGDITCGKLITRIAVSNNPDAI